MTLAALQWQDSKAMAQLAALRFTVVRWYYWMGDHYWTLG